jgi:LacI family transcriptional regulator
MNNVTIKWLAEELNLSPSSVSKALNDSHEIGISTKQKVLALAKEHNYEPNIFASNLRKQASKTIAVIVPEIANHFFSKAITGIEEMASKKGYHVIIYQTHDDVQTEIDFAHRLLNGRVDGILISISSNTQNNEHLSNMLSNIPTVIFDRANDEVDAIKILTNDYESAYEATSHLIHRGCQKISFLSGLDKLSTGKNRFMGYKDALADHGIVYNQNLYVKYGKDPDLNYTQIKDHLRNQKPNGVLSSVEELVLPLYAACRELSISIPDDLKIVSYSNIDTAAFLNPSLTTITQPAFEIGQEAASVLFNILDKKWSEPNETYILKSSLLIRESTGGNCCQIKKKDIRPLEMLLHV